MAVGNTDETLHPGELLHTFVAVLYHKHCGVATAMGHAYCTLGAPTPHTNVRRPKAGPQSVDRIYEYAACDTTGAAAFRTAVPFALSVVGSVLSDALVPAGAATAPTAALSMGAASDVPPMTPEKDSCAALSRRTGAGPVRPPTYTAEMPAAAAAGDAGHVALRMSCRKDSCPMLTPVAAPAAASQFTMVRSRRGTVMRYGSERVAGRVGVLVLPAAAAEADDDDAAAVT